MDETPEPLISICTPVYNTETRLRTCVESLFRARMAERCEFIFVDDGSTDGSPQILKELCDSRRDIRTKIVRHRQNRGVAAARNTALAEATGTFIIHIDSDDSVRPDFLEKLYTAAVQNGADLVVSNNWRDIDGGLPNVQLIRRLLTHEMPITLWCKIARLSLFRDNGVSWKEGINVGEDPIISVKLQYFSRKTVFLRDHLYDYREGIGFVTRLDTSVILRQKELEFREIERFAREHGFYDEIADIIELRNAEIRYEFLKREPPLSLKKYRFMEGHRLSVLCERRADFARRLPAILVRLVDGGHFFLANAMYALYAARSALKGGGQEEGPPPWLTSPF